jgi:hypothetical protein
MSGSAEVYLTITADKEKSPNRYPEIVDKWLAGAGFFTSGENYRRTSVQSGDIYEVRGYHVSYDVFDQEWSADLVNELHLLDKELDVEVFVYDLDRTADASYRTKDIPEDYDQEDDEPQGCSHCFNPEFSCACGGGVGRQTPVEVIK